MTKDLPKALADFFSKRKITPFDFQKDAWKSYLDGKDTLIHAPTGFGKTYAAWLGPVIEFLNSPEEVFGTRVLWLTPLRALAHDSTQALEDTLSALSLPWTIEKRTGDSSSSVKAKQRKRMPDVLVTTPESLSLLLSYPETKDYFSNLKAVVVDEWHTLVGTKRGVQTELALARLRTWSPQLRATALSATIGNTEVAAQVLAGAHPKLCYVIRGLQEKRIAIETLIPRQMESFPWMGHLGLRMLSDVVEAIESANTTLLFTNVRSQTEVWFQSILKAKPEWAELIAIHHGSIENEKRVAAEEGLRTGKLKCVVATSSLDLGVDFSPVDQVIQVGGPKGVARLIQRAGRSGHQPGKESRILCVPAHAFELLEFSAARDALNRSKVESRIPLVNSIDVLIQHVVTVGLGGGFRSDDLFNEVRSSYAFQTLSRDAWNWVVDFVSKGGKTLQAYPQYLRLVFRDGMYAVESKQVARLHRMSIGTILSDGTVRVQLMRGGALGTVEESFVARLKPGDHFVFAGQVLELVRIFEMVAFVVKAKKSKAAITKWNGAKMPLSSELSELVRETLADFPKTSNKDREMKAITPILKIQQTSSSIPKRNETLVEQRFGENGFEIYVYPFEGRLVHEGVASLMAYRISKKLPASLGVVVNDYGYQLLSTEKFKLDAPLFLELCRKENLLEDILECVNMSELAKRQFREIARIAGLIFPGYPGSKKSTRQVQASSTLFFDVFSKYDPDNLLLDEARRQVLESQLEFQRLSGALDRLLASRPVFVTLEKLSPFAFPMWAEFTQAHVSSESWTKRLDRMLKELGDSRVGGLEE